MWLVPLLVGIGVGCGPDGCGNPVEPERPRGLETGSRSDEAEETGRSSAAAKARPPLERGPGEEAAFPPLRGRVVKVVDGDTIHVRLDGRGREKVRYIGVDTPETKHPRIGVEPFGPEASALNRDLIGGRRVQLRFDRQLRDRYGRLLAYVYREPDGLFVNAELVRRGLAEVMRVPPNVRHAERFEALEREARAAGRGMWASGPPSGE